MSESGLTVTVQQGPGGHYPWKGEQAYSSHVTLQWCLASGMSLGFSAKDFLVLSRMKNTPIEKPGGFVKAFKALSGV